MLEDRIILIQRQTGCICKHAIQQLEDSMDAQENEQLTGIKN